MRKGPLLLSSSHVALYSTLKEKQYKCNEPTFITNKRTMNDS